MTAIRLISAAFLLTAAAAPFACTIEKAPPQQPPPAPVATAAPAPTETQVDHLPCAPIGQWKVAGAGGSQSIRVTNATQPGAFDVWYNGVQAGSGTQQQNHFQFDTGAASAGLASCELAKDCKTMSCGFKGQQPVVFNKQ